MKKIFFISIITLGFTIGGCKKFLEQVPTTFVAPENYFNNEAEVNTALAAVYDIVGREQVYGGQIPIRHTPTTDESFFSYTNFKTGPHWFNFGAEDATVRILWQYMYDGIERANVLLANLDKAEMDENKKSVVRGEALFLRGFFYFILAENWGGVPLKLTPTASINDVDIPRTPLKDVYAQILKDMTEAEALVPRISDIGHGGRVSKSAVRGMLARVCLTMAGEPLKDVSKFEDARSWAQKVNEFGEHDLNPDYKQVFINLCQDKYDIKESIWEAEEYGTNSDAFREGGRIGNENGVSCKPSAANIPNVGYAYGFISATRKLYYLYGTGDLRRDWAIASYRLSSTGVKSNLSASTIYPRNCAKWRREYETLRPYNKNYTPTNFQILRYADVLLMFAEAENEVNGPTAAAYDAINQVRRRGYGLPVHSPSAVADLPANLGKDDFRKAVQDERARELCFEGLRKYDLIRWGIFLSTMQQVATEFETYAPDSYQYAADAARNVSQRYLLYPIPILEMSLNKAIEQNPGY